MRKTLFMVFLAITLLYSLIPIGYGFSTSSAQPATTAPAGSKASQLPPIKIGHIVDLAGSEATVGKNFQRVLDFSFESINYTIAGRKVEIIVGDAQGQPNTAVDVARKMVENDKVVAILGPTQAGQKMAVAGYMNQAGIPLILYNPTPMALYASGKIKWVVGAGGSERQDPTCMADYIYNQLKYRTINTLAVDNTGGRMFLAPLTDLFTKMGGQVVQQQWAPVPCPDFAPYLTTLKPADALVAWNPGSDAIKFFSQYREMGIKMPVVNHFAGGYLDVFVAKALGPANASAILGVPGPMMYSPDSTDPVNQRYVKAFTAKFGFPPPDSGYTAADTGALVFIELVKATGGDTTPAKLMQAVPNIKVNAPEGALFFAAGSLVATRTVFVCTETQTPNGFAYKTLYTYKDVPPTGYVPKK